MKEPLRKIQTFGNLLYSKIEKKIEPGEKNYLDKIVSSSHRMQTLIEDVLTRVEPAARQRGVHFEKEIQPVTVEVVEDDLTMLMDNLLVNAVNYSYENGVVHVSCCGQASGETLIMVRDQGIGIPKEKLPRIFDDYYRTEEAVQHNR